MNSRRACTIKTAFLPGMIVVSILLAGLAGCANPLTGLLPSAVTGITLNKTALSLAVGSTERLIGTIAPLFAKNKAMTWSSSNDANVTVSDSGIVTAVAPGSAVVTVTSVEGAFTDSCEVLVTAPKAVTGVALNKHGATIAVGSTEQLVAVVSPLDADNENVAWSSAGNAVSVSATGLVSAVSPGSATITVTTEEGSFTDSCSVTVFVPSVAVTGVTLNKDTTSIVLGQTEQLLAAIAPLDATNKAVTWSSSNANAGVSAAGSVTALAIGTSTITVRTADGSFTDSCVVTVTPVRVTGIALNKAVTTIYPGSTEQLIATIAPANATNKTITWSSNSANAGVSTSGLVSALAVGSATITATTTDGSFKASCVVTIAPVRVTGVTLNKTVSTLPLGTTEQLTATVAPSNATNKSVTWSSSSANAGVSSSGLVTALALGSATITVTTSDGSFSATFAVTVVPVPVTGVSLNKTSTTLVAGNSESLVATVNPANAANKAVTWTSGDESVAYVAAGQVMGLAAGTATITVTTTDGAFKATCLVTITGALAHTYAEVQPALTVLQAGLNAAAATTDSTASAYYTVELTPTLSMTSHFHDYAGSGYLLNGSVKTDYNADYTRGAMNGTVLFTGGIVSEVSYHDAYFSAPMSGTIAIGFSDGTSGTMNLATGTFTQN